MATAKKPSSPKPVLSEVHFISMVHIYDSCIRGEVKEIKLRALTGNPKPLLVDDPGERMLTIKVKTGSHGIVHHRIPYENISRLVYMEPA